MTNPTLPQEDVAKVAEGLHRHDRFCLLGDPHRVEGSVASLMSLCFANLANIAKDGRISLTPLGLAVRSHLLGEKP